MFEIFLCGKKKKKKKKRNLVLPVSGRSFSLPVADEAESEP